MDYFNEAFCGFSPDSDRDAALRFSLCILALDNRVHELLQLVEGGNNLGGIEGEPGWIIERREDGETLGYENWPNDARFRAYVDPDSYSLRHPEFFADRLTFFQYVGALARVYKNHHPEYEEIVRRIEEVIEAERD